MTNYELRIIADCPNSGPALELYRRALAEEGRDAEVHVREVSSEDEARELGFHGSPTFMIGGRDLFPSSAEPAVTCRVYPTPDGLSGQPSLAALRLAVRLAILRAAQPK
ncbi:hypothetical protein [Arthrobacter sp. CJ23]|uniref:hypothetical protein n=1 Tax=Arthrobacter sp. CJ23 TaxID=2972479 RepID=UPI00215D50CA|nr:hypothetical protein [Arthrobacter sp. CJ23]UVJ40383.1 hypothetical protein NVV90_04175 [Arthrobacter sp. CJ23]